MRLIVSILVVALLGRSSVLAVTKNDLKVEYPTLEAAAHRFGVVDLEHTVDHHLVLIAAFPRCAQQWTGMVEEPAEFQDVDPIRFSLDHVVTHTGLGLVGLEGSRRSDIIVWDDPRAGIRKKGNRYRVGTVREDLTVEIFPELTDAFPGQYVYIPEFDAVFESPFSLPRISYSRVAARRPLVRNGLARFARAEGGTVSLRVDVVRHAGDSRRFFVAGKGPNGFVLGELFPFARPSTDRQERHYYQHDVPLDRRLEFALYNELAGFQTRDEPALPDNPSIVFGLKIYDRYLDRFDAALGPVLKGLPADHGPMERHRSIRKRVAGRTTPGASATSTSPGSRPKSRVVETSAGNATKRAP